MHRLLAAFALLCTLWSQAQVATLSGSITYEDGSAAALTSVAVVGEKASTQADEEGQFTLSVPAGKPITVLFNLAGMTAERKLELSEGERRTVNVKLDAGELGEQVVTVTREPGMEVMNPRTLTLMPNPTGDAMGLIKGGLGVMSRNELSSGYSVRGGNFDENLVYVNDIEVYRPFLVRAGQQEGLSFPNADMIQSIRFSPGGFEARYGDKMSSVLDITYKRPREFEGTASIGLMGGSFSIATPMLNKRLRQVTGFRYRTLQNLLSGLDTQGDYDARYTDLQTYWTYDLSDKVELGFLGVYSRNKYNVVPEDRETELGNIQTQALRFKVFFDGQEKTAFETFFGAVNLNVRPDRDVLLKFTASAFRTFESEYFDVLGQYYLQELDRDLGSDQFGEAIRNLGVGSNLDHARNDLDATVLTFAHRGFLQRPKSYLQWGADVRSEVINDKLSEWTLIDSADYSIPRNTGEDLLLSYSLKTKLNIESIRTSGYVQNAWEWKLDSVDRPGRYIGLTAGVRAQYWTYNGQSIVSPRARFVFSPGGTRLDKAGRTVDRQHTYWLATGLYYQAPFYRELRGFDGQLNPELRAQQSIHLMLGMERQMKLWDRPFKFTTEAYYKFLSDLVPYEVDNVRIRYYATNNSKGYAMGLDAKLNGEMIPGIESWISMSVMSTFEDILDDYYYLRFNANGDTIIPGYTFDQVAVDSVMKTPGYIPRPTDQRVSVSLFFQDEMPQWPTFKVHMNLVFGTGLPFGPPNETRYADTLRTSLYRRVDIGFSKQFLGAKGQEKTNFLRHINSLTLSLEVFNLLNINNTVNYTWISDVSGRQYAVPDYLTPRRLNLKLIATF
ncbi:MAG: TonB-dependent receptor [Flavobacteriales bacterium]|nr:TonB-dependent receptor [Flavobacteriales bacterium]MBK9288363.1 TonB-dependent receptor [Flavobacteriales bacterium]